MAFWFAIVAYLLAAAASWLRPGKPVDRAARLTQSPRSPLMSWPASPTSIGSVADGRQER
jgi:hypothetical protein